jgi:lipopolysaccharide transport system ATP-binding protein
MSDIAIKVEALGKRYRIGARQQGFRTLRERLNDLALIPVRALGSLASRNEASRNGNSQSSRTTYDSSVIADDLNSENSESKTIWALKQIAFQVKRGEVVGIVGRNGAGKSTLLKVLSRITEPTEGEVDIYGRVGSLLEVGTGFHPELTGRENIYLSGAILGMMKAEIKRKFDSIVAFAEIERFLDTPVKHYSSGMYIRLAFSVAIQLEPDVLLVDEVLAVGDLAFQQKCLSYMRDLTTSGMTILLVSHNMAAIQSSCHRAILLDKGMITADGRPQEVIESYRHSLQHDERNKTSYGSSNSRDLQESYSDVEIIGFEMFGEDGVSRRNFKFGESIRIRINLNARRRISSPLINFGIKRADGVVVCNFNNWYDNFRIDYIEGECSLEGWLPPLRLIPDFFEVHVLVWPWGGGHLHGDMTRSMPYAAKTFGDFCIYGPSLNSHDGVFQMPTKRWRFRRAGNEVDYASMTPNSLEQVFGEDENHYD